MKMLHAFFFKMTMRFCDGECALFCITKRSNTFCAETQEEV